ncbi:hypothetical protein QYQ98_03315 [Corynebacterium sp. P3-F1]|uniref:hypothetical protein n=1 Tax=Corynebacterium sp. P3-F1 TaxID=3059080 RepID=UPI00265CD579|nr:hypothetical protein [Corynebacterium sp. P3-F1]WKK61932.1 hypothetical protein QYQ98_03315 [Corynebacterium sp. P3-F1]
MDSREMDGASNTIVIDCPVRSIEDLGAGIIAAVYAPEERTSPQLTGPANPNERPVPRNLDALADLLRETQAHHLVVTDWHIPTEVADRLLDVLALEGVQLTSGQR